MTDSDAIDALREALPAWLPWALTMAPTAILVVTLALTHFVSMRRAGLGREAQDLHWTERARRHYSHRRQQAAVALILSSGGAFVLARLWHPLFAGPRSLALCALVVGPILLLIGLGSHARRSAGLPRRAGSLRGFLSALLVIYMPVVITLVTLLVTPAHWGRTTWACLGVGAVLTVFFGRGAGIRLARTLGLVRAAPEWLQGAAPEGVTVGVLPLSIHQAFAFTLTRFVGFTEPVIRDLERGQILRVLDHEVGHIQDPDFKAVRSSLPLYTLPILGALKPLAATFGWAGLVLPIVLWVALMRWVKGRTLQREETADEFARDQVPEAKAEYARALERMHELNGVPAVHVAGGAAAQRTHPNLYDRMLAAGVTPNYPRPAPPGRGSRLLLLLPATVLLLLFFAPYQPVASQLPFESVPVRLLGFAPASEVISAAAIDDTYGGEDDRSLVLIRGAEALFPGWPGYTAMKAWIAAYAGESKEARAAIEEARAAMATGRLDLQWMGAWLDQAEDTLAE